MVPQNIYNYHIIKTRRSELRKIAIFLITLASLGDYPQPKVEERSDSTKKIRRFSVGWGITLLALIGEFLVLKIVGLKSEVLLANSVRKSDNPRRACESGLSLNPTIFNKNNVDYRLYSPSAKSLLTN